MNNTKEKDKNYTVGDNNKNFKRELILNFNSTVQMSEEFILISNFKQKGYFLSSALLVLML